MDHNKDYIVIKSFRYMQITFNTRAHGDSIDCQGYFILC